MCFSRKRWYRKHSVKMYLTGLVTPYEVHVGESSLSYNYNLIGPIVNYYNRLLIPFFFIFHTIAIVVYFDLLVWFVQWFWQIFRTTIFVDFLITLIVVIVGLALSVANAAVLVYLSPSSFLWARFNDSVSK